MTDGNNKLQIWKDVQDRAEPGYRSSLLRNDPARHNKFLKDLDNMKISTVYNRVDCGAVDAYGDKLRRRELRGFQAEMLKTAFELMNL